MIPLMETSPLEVSYVNRKIEISKDYDISGGALEAIKAGITWKHVRNDAI